MTTTVSALQLALIKGRQQQTWAAGDYGMIRGLRAADGHLRRATFAIMRAMKGLRESAAPAVPTAPPVDTVARKDTTRKRTARL